MSSRRHQARAQVRRDALLRATVEVVGTKGFAGITHRAVTEAAGLPLATVSYFFPSIAALAREAMEVFVGADIALLNELASSLAMEQRKADDVISAFALATTPRWPDTAALFDAYLTAARQPEFRDTIGAALIAARRTAAAGVTAAGAPRGEEVAAGLVALSQGFAFHTLAVPDLVDNDAQRRALRTMFIGHLVECGLVDEALQMLTP